MLLEVSIRDIALIDRVNASFEPGLNVLTGETGAGKSIVVGALDFVLGGRADRDRVAFGAERGRVEAIFDVTNLPRVREAMEAMGLEAEGGLLPISRELTAAGRSVSRAAGEIVSASQLRSLTSLLVDLHGQHGHQSLLGEDNHLRFLDAMGKASHRALLEETREAFRRFREAAHALSSAREDARERARREDMLRFQLEELDGANLVEDEEIELERLRDLHRNAERIRAALEAAYALAAFREDEAPSALDALRAAADSLRGVRALDARYEAVEGSLLEASYRLEEVCATLDSLREETEVDPEQLEQIESRLDLLSRLRRKYGQTTREMIAFRERTRAALEEAEDAGDRAARLAREEAECRAAYDGAAARLSESRRALAGQCQAQVLSQLADLGMDGAAFEIAFEALAEPSRDGGERAAFLLSANRGEPLRPLAKVASGGELSRIMLAFKCVEAEAEGVPVLIFDEIDSGLGGRMGQIVGEKMHAVSGHRQVLCVTHLPQIAAMADAQYLVEKREEGERTRTRLTKVSGERRAEIVAQMLGGGETGLEHAKALLKGKP